MSSDASPDTPIERAIREKENIQKALREAAEDIEKIDAFIKAHKELPGAIALNLQQQVAPLIEQRNSLEKTLQPYMQRLSQLEQFLATYRSLSSVFEKQPATEAGATLSRGGVGMTQSLFVRFALMVLRDVGRPMQSGEFVDEFRKRGHEIGGANETKTAWNRLWEARRDGDLTHINGLGYWIPGEELPDGAEEAARTAQGDRRREAKGKGRALGRPKTTRRGRQPILTPAQRETVERMLVSGEKTVSEVCVELGGISSQTLYNYFGSIKTLREKYPELAKEADAKPERSRSPRPRLQRIRKRGNKRLGRPPSIAGEVKEKAERMYLNGASMKEIATALDINLTSVYRYFGVDNKEHWQKRKAEHEAQGRNRRG